jgi:hypothetical protein
VFDDLPLTVEHIDAVLEVGAVFHAGSPCTGNMAKKRKYEPRIFEGRVMTPADLERVHKETLGFERIEAVSDEMRALIEELWPELVYMLPPMDP